MPMTLREAAQASGLTRSHAWRRTIPLMSEPVLSPAGRVIRRWRAIRRMSQLDLAIAAGTTARHVSFVETGRSRPGPDVLLRIGEALDLPLAERNALLSAAGLLPVFPVSELGSADLAPVERALDHILHGHEPYPAWVVRQPFTFLRANSAAEAMFPGLTALPAEDVIDLWFGPGPFRECVVNWSEVAHAGLAALRRAAAGSSDPKAAELARRAEKAAQLEPSAAVSDGTFPVICPVFELGGQVVRTVSAVMRFDTAVEVTTSQLQVELMFPADEIADTFFRRLRPDGQHGPGQSMHR